MVILLWSKSDSDYRFVPSMSVDSPLESSNNMIIAPAQDAVSYKKELLMDNLTFLKDKTKIPDLIIRSLDHHRQNWKPLRPSWFNVCASKLATSCTDNIQSPVFACRKTR